MLLKDLAMNKVQILTLMSGRWYTWNPYWHGVSNLDWPKKDLEIFWYTNGDEVYQKFLLEISALLKNEGWDIRLFIDNSIKPSYNAFVTQGIRTVEHAVAIASLYNAAWKRIDKSKRVFLIEDDIAVPSHSLKRFMRDLNEDKDAFYVTGVAYDRHSPQMFAWEIEKEPKGWFKNKTSLYISYEPQHTWGVRQIGASGLGCTLIEPKRIPKRIKKRKLLFMPQAKTKGAEHFVGCDIELCFTSQYVYGGKCLIDYDVRVLHYDDKKRPH